MLGGVHFLKMYFPRRALQGTPQNGVCGVCKGLGVYGSGFRVYGKSKSHNIFPTNPKQKFSESGLPGGQNLSGPCGSILRYTKAYQRPYKAKSEK